MINPYAFELMLKLEQQILDERQARQAAWRAYLPRGSAVSPLAGVRRTMARLLLLVADRLDPRAVVSAPHVPAAPALNGTLHHA
jgi:hypothetical protein